MPRTKKKYMDVKKMSEEIKIKDKVYMENEKLKICNEVDIKLKNYFKQYLNEKIFLVDGSLLKKIKEDKAFKDIMEIKNYTVTPLKNGHVSLNMYVHHTTYNCICYVKLCFNGGSYEDKTYYCIYTEYSVYIGNLENNILKNLDVGPADKIPLLDAEYQEKQITLFKEKSKELKEIRAKIAYALNDFIKYDLVN